VGVLRPPTVAAETLPIDKFHPHLGAGGQSTDRYTATSPAFPSRTTEVSS
jgi:hypothetical protein